MEFVSEKKHNYINIRNVKFILIFMVNICVNKMINNERKREKN